MVPESYHNLHSRDKKPIFHLATLFARRAAKTKIRQRYWLKLAGENIRREQIRQVENTLKEVKISRYRSMCHDLPHSRCMCRKISIASVDTLFIAISRVCFLPIAILLCLFIAWLKPYNSIRLL